MDENFHFQIRKSRNIGDFRNRQLARRDDAREADVAGVAGALRVVDGHLRGGVERDFRKVFLHKLEDGPVLHDERVRLHVAKPRQRVDELRQFAFSDKRIDRDIDFPRPFRIVVGESENGRKVVEGEIIRVRACGEVL